MQAARPDQPQTLHLICKARVPNILARSYLVMYWVVILSSALLSPAPPISPGSTTSISAGSSRRAGSSICGSSSSLAKTSYSSPPSPSPYSLSDIPLVRVGDVRLRTCLGCVGVAAEGWAQQQWWWSEQWESSGWLEGTASRSHPVYYSFEY